MDSSHKAIDSTAKRVQKVYIAQAAFEYFVSLLVTDAYLAKLLTYMGLSDSLIGIISSLISFSFLFQLFTIALTPHIHNTKRTVIIFDTISQFFFAGIYLVPLLKIPVALKAIIVITFILIAYFLKYLISSVFFKWVNSFVEPAKRASFSALKESISLLSGIIFSLGTGYIVDHFDAINKIEVGFIVLAVVLTVLNGCNLASLLLINNEKCKERSNSKINLKIIYQHTIRNRKFMNVVLASSLYSVAYYISTGFMGTFKTSDLMLSVSAVQIMNMVGSFSRIIISKPFGKFSDRTSYATGFRVGMLVLAVAYAFNMFSTPESRWCVAVFTVLQSVSLAGTNQNKINICYNYVENDFLVYAMAIQNSISGLVGFGASILGGRILTCIQENGNQFLGINIYGQQILSAVSLMIILITVLFTKIVVEKQERFLQ